MWVVTSSFHFLYYLFGPFFFMMCLAKCLSVLVIFSKYQFLVSLIYSFFFFASISLISALMFMISFLLLTLGLIALLFLIPLFFFFSPHSFFFFPCLRFKKYGMLHEFACHPCAGAMLIFSVLFQF